MLATKSIIISRCAKLITLLVLVAHFFLGFASAEPIHKDILYISDEIKAELDREIRPIHDRARRAVALHWLMFDTDSWNIDYSADHTYSAMETYENRKGNCISLAALYVAAARYVNLPAKFQSVSVPSAWTPKDGYYLLTGHVNALVRLRRQTIHIDFLQTFLDLELKEVKKRSINDDQAYGEFHNNIAMELVEKKDFELAKQHMEIAISYDPDSDFIWSNYGVLHKFEGDFERAEKKYKKALDKNKRNFSALTNLYILYNETGRHAEAQVLAEKVERYSRNNPYHLAKLAQSSLREKRYPEALSLIKKAIKKDKKVADFHHVKAKILYESGKYELSLEALERARKVSEEKGNNDDIEIYRKKIESLISRM